MHTSIPHPHGLFSGRRAAQLGATWATLHRDDAPTIHLRTVLLLVGLSLGSAAAAVLVVHLLARTPVMTGSPTALGGEAAVALLRSSPSAITPSPSLASALAGTRAEAATASSGASALAALASPQSAAASARTLLAAPAAVDPETPAPDQGAIRLVSAAAALPLPSLALAPSLVPAAQPALPLLTSAPLPLTLPAIVALPVPAPEPVGPAMVTIVAKVTGYCPCAICCGDRAEGVTSINRNVYRHPRGIAVDPRLLAYRSYLDVPGYGTAMVDDTGSAMRSDGEHGIVHLDVRFKTHAEALSWGVRWLPIQVPADCQAARLPAADEIPAQ